MPTRLITREETRLAVEKVATKLSRAETKATNLEDQLSSAEAEQRVHSQFFLNFDIAETPSLMKDIEAATGGRVGHGMGDQTRLLIATKAGAAAAAGPTAGGAGSGRPGRTTRVTGSSEHTTTPAGHRAQRATCSACFSAG